MGDDSSNNSNNQETLVSSIKKEWSLFWESISSEGGEAAQTGRPHPLKSLTVEDVKKITKTLSQDRRKINRKLESINKEIEDRSLQIQELHEKAESVEAEMAKIRELHEQGQKLSIELAKLDETLRFARRADLAMP